MQELTNKQILTIARALNYMKFDLISCELSREVLEELSGELQELEELFFDINKKFYYKDIREV